MQPRGFLLLLASCHCLFRLTICRGSRLLHSPWQKGKMKLRFPRFSTPFLLPDWARQHNYCISYVVFCQSYNHYNSVHLLIRVSRVRAPDRACKVPVLGKCPWGRCFFLPFYWIVFLIHLRRWFCSGNPISEQNKNPCKPKVYGDREVILD